DVDEGEFRVRLELPRGTPIEQTVEAAERLERIFLEDAEVEVVFAQIGRQFLLTGQAEEESGTHTAQLDVRLVEGGRTAAVLARLRPRLAGFPPGVLAIETSQATALGQLLGGAEADLAVR